MGIGFVGGTSGHPPGGSYTTTLNYVSTAGNFLFLSIAVNGQYTPSVIDSNGTSWTVVTGGLIGSIAYLLGANNHPAVTSVLIYEQSPTVGTTGVVLGEYSSVGPIVGTYTEADADSNTPFTWGVSKSLSSSNNWFLAGGEALNGSFDLTASSNTGNFRGAEINGASELAILVDNTGGGTVTCSSTVSSTPSGKLTAWDALGIEVAPSINATVTPAGVTIVSGENNPTSSGGANATPSGVTISSAVNTLSATGDANALPFGVTVSSSVNAPSRSGDANVSPFGVTMVSAVNRPIILGLYPSLYHYGFGF